MAPATVATTINRRGSELIERAKQLGPLKAYVVCGAVATAVVAALNLALILALAGWTGHISEAATADNLVRGFVVWFFITMIGYAVAAPFVIIATWAGAAMRIESLGYYVGFGALVMTVLVFAIFGLPRHTPFGSVNFAWTIGPPCAGAWGATGWYLHRRWRARRR